MDSFPDKRSSRWRFSQRAKFIFFPAFALAVINFTSFMAVNLYLGGDASNGYTKNGHYFLGSHGHYTEVASDVWTYSYYHSHSVWVTHLLVFALVALFLNTGDMVIEKT
jgi:hypothetical protein